MDDAGLVRAAVGGNRSAFADIYDRYADRVHAFATSVLRDPDEAADVTQDTFLIAARRLDQLRDPSRLRPWLFAIARHEAFARSKKRQRQVLTDEVDDFESSARSAEDVMTSQDAVAIVHAAAAGLTERDRAVLDLSLRHGLEGEELGAAMGISAGHASVLAGRVRDRVEKSLGALLVARLGRDDCVELQGLLGDWDGSFSPLVRKRVARHVGGCATCAATKKRVASPAALLAGMPIVVAPASLRARVLDAFDAHVTATSPSGSSGSESEGSGPGSEIGSGDGDVGQSQDQGPSQGEVGSGDAASSHGSTNGSEVASGDLPVIQPTAPLPPTSPSSAPPPTPVIHLKRDGFPRSSDAGRKLAAAVVVMLLLLGGAGLGLAVAANGDSTETVATGGSTQEISDELVDEERNVTIVEEDKADEASAGGGVVAPGGDPFGQAAEEDPAVGSGGSTPDSGGGGSTGTVPPVVPPPPPPPPADTSPPSVTAFSGSSTIRSASAGCPPGGPTTTTLQATVSDNVGVTSVTSNYGALSGGGSSWSRTIGPFSTGPGGTPMPIAVTATDAAGNSASTSTSVIVVC